jgi:hypothetical protein
MLEVASDADQRRLGVGAQLRWARAKCRQRRLNLLDESDGLADGQDVLPLLVSNSAQQILSVQVSWTKGRCH